MDASAAEAVAAAAQSATTGPAAAAGYDGRADGCEWWVGHGWRAVRWEMDVTGRGGGEEERMMGRKWEGEGMGE